MIAHFLQSLHEIGFSTGLVVSAAIDISIQTCGQIEIVAGTVFPHLMVQRLCKLDGAIDLIMSECIETFVAQQLIIEHHITFLVQVFAILFGIAIKVIR